MRRLLLVPPFHPPAPASILLAACLALAPLSGCGREEPLSAPEGPRVYRREDVLFDPAHKYTDIALPPALLVPGWCFAESYARVYQALGPSESEFPFAESPPMDVDCRPPFPMLPPHGGGVVGVGDEAVRQLLVVSSELFLPDGLFEPDDEARELRVTSRGGSWRLAVRTVRRGLPLGPLDAGPKWLAARLSLWRGRP